MTIGQVVWTLDAIIWGLIIWSYWREYGRRPTYYRWKDHKGRPTYGRYRPIR